MVNLNQRRLLGIEINLPSILTQTELIRRVETLFAYADRLEARYHEARAQVERLTPALLAKAFRGELVPQDPNDEPASVLLARLQAERATAATKGPTNGKPKGKTRGADLAPRPQLRPATPAAASNGHTPVAVPLPFATEREATTPAPSRTATSDDSADEDPDEAPHIVAHPRLAPPDIDEFDRETLLATLREVFTPGLRYDAETAIRTTAHTLGYGRTGARIHDRLKNTLRVAVQRGILVNEAGEYRLDCRTIHDYPRDLFQQSFLAAMGRAWIERDEAIKLATRHLGFRRTGPAIQQAFRAVITLALRRGYLEADRDLIRKRS